MATRLIVRYPNTAHRFVKTAKVTITPQTLAAPPELKGSKLGEHLFDLSAVPVGSVFLLTVEIPLPQFVIDEINKIVPPPSSPPPPLLEIKQSMQIILSKGVVIVQPNPTSPSNRFGGGFHPRLNGHLVNAGGGHNYYIDVDILFLKVNRLDGAKSSRFSTPYLRSQPILPGAVTHYGCRLNLYEYTGRDSRNASLPAPPNVWPVLIPPAVKPDTKTVHTMMFFRPPLDDPYDTIEDAPPARTVRYVADPPQAGPFFIDKTIRPPDPPVRFASNCGFERALAESNKPVILALPVPQNGGYGHAAGRTWPDLLKSLVFALWAENDIGQNLAQGLVLGRTAVGGFSAGGLSAFSCLATNPDALNELYLFDAKDFSEANRRNLKSWMAKGGKKLRMIGGGLFHGAMLAVAAELKSADATVIPTSADAFFSNALYKSAVSLFTFDSSSSLRATAGGISDKTGIFLTGPTPGKLGFRYEGRKSNGDTIAVDRDVLGFGTEEFALSAFLYHNSFTLGKKDLDKEFARHRPPEVPPAVPSTTGAEFTRLLQTLEGRAKSLRHQWAVCGGEDSASKTDRLGTFKGFLQLCIEQGNFP